MLDSIDKEKKDENKEKEIKENFKNIITQLYHKRWKIESEKWDLGSPSQSLATTEYHKSLKSLLGLTRSPTKNQITQSNHFFSTIYSYFKLEVITKFTQFKNNLKSITSTTTKTLKNHFDLKAQIYIKANQLAFKELQLLKSEIKELKVLVSCER